MDLNLIPSTLWLLLVVLASQGLVTGVNSLQKPDSQDDDPTTSIQSRILKRMDAIQNRLSNLTLSMGDLEDEISQALSNCLGLHTELCEALNVDSRFKDKDHLPSWWDIVSRTANKDANIEEYRRIRRHIPSLWATHARSASKDPKIDAYRRLYKDLSRRKRVLNKLSDLFEKANKVIGSERKRSCNFNLGFHCQTEEVSDFADFWDYLESPLSPGRKRSSQ